MRFHHHAFLCLSAATLASAGSTNAHASTIFTDRAAFEDASILSIEEGFDESFGEPTNPAFSFQAGQTFTLGDLTFIANRSTKVRTGTNDVLGSAFHSGDSLALSIRRADGQGDGPFFDPFSIINTQDVHTAFGVDLLALNTQTPATNYFIDLAFDGVVVESFSGVAANSFFGVVSDTAFNSVSLRAANSTGFEVFEAYDNLAFGVAVPAPASALTLFAAPFMARRRRGTFTRSV